MIVVAVKHIGESGEKGEVGMVAYFRNELYRAYSPVCVFN